MRTIKFRGTPVFGDRWVYGGILQSGSGIYIIEPDANIIDSKIYKIDPETVGQFTGLYDKNGKGIYEGDIIRYDNKSNDDSPKIGCVEAITFEDAGFLPISEWYCQNVEIVGNIYDNPELLKGGER